MRPLRKAISGEGLKEMLYRFSMITREDKRIGMYSPEAKEALILTRDQFKDAFLQMIQAGHAEVMPREDTHLGLFFGSMSKTAWEKLVSISKRVGAEII